MTGHTHELKQEYTDPNFWKVSHVSQSLDELMAEMEQ